MEYLKKVIAIKFGESFLKIMSNNVTFVVLAAGIGSRYNGNKQLETFGDKNLTVAEFNMLHAIECGIKNFVLIVNESVADNMHRRIKNFLPKNCTFSIVYQKEEHDLCKFCCRTKPWGTAHAILCCQKAINGNFCVTNADDLYGKEAIQSAIEATKNFHEKSPTFANIAYSLTDTLSANGPVSRGILSVDDDHHLQSIKEISGIVKDNLNDLHLDSNTLVSMNLWGFTPMIFDLLNSEWEKFKENISDPSTEEFFISTALNSLIQSKRCSVDVIMSNCKWYGITYRSDKALLEEVLQHEC